MVRSTRRLLAEKLVTTLPVMVLLGTWITLLSMVVSAVWIKPIWVTVPSAPATET